MTRRGAGSGNGGNGGGNGGGGELTAAERRRMDRARMDRERADIRRQANLGTSRQEGSGDRPDRQDSTGGLPTHSTDTLLSMLRERFGKGMTGIKHRGRFTGEPIAVAGDAIQYKSLRRTLETYCKPYKTSVSIDRLVAVRQRAREAGHLAKLEEDCELLPREIGSGSRLTSVEGEDFLWHIPDAMAFPAFRFQQKSFKKQLQKAIPRAVEGLFATDGRRQPTRTETKKRQYKWHYGFTPPSEDSTIRHAMGSKRPNPGLGDAEEMVFHLGIWPDLAFRTFGVTADTCQTTSKGKRTIAQFYADMTEPLHVIGSLFEACCPAKYKEYEDIYLRAMDRGGTADISVSDRQVFCTMAILHNCQVDPHKDAGDIRDGWVAMTCVGDFEDGLLILPELKLKLQYLPGDLVFMRSSLVEHYISNYSGHRTSMVFFTKGTTKEWMDANLQHEVKPWLQRNMLRKPFEFEMANKHTTPDVKPAKLDANPKFERFRPY